MNEVQIMAMDNLKEQKIWLSTSSVVFKSMPLMYRISSMVAGQTIQHCSHPPREFIHGQENIRCYFFYHTQQRCSHPPMEFIHSWENVRCSFYDFQQQGRTSNVVCQLGNHHVFFFDHTHLALFTPALGVYSQLGKRPMLLPNCLRIGSINFVPSPLIKLICINVHLYQGQWGSLWGHCLH